MSDFTRMLRQTFTVARRDFVATVFTPTFLVFLAAPLMMVAFGAVGGLGARQVAASAGDRTHIVAIASGADAASLQAADTALRRLYRSDEGPPALRIEAPAGDPLAQARALLAAKGGAATAALAGPLERPHLYYVAPSERHATYLGQLAEDALRLRSNGGKAMSVPVVEPVRRSGASRIAEGAASYLAVVALFVLSLMLTSQAVGTMAEERSNKVIEVLAAAVPLEAVFLGKLVGMFGVALVFIGFWGTVIGQGGALLPGPVAGLMAEASPATGAAFPFIFFAYFTMAYLLLGAVFLGIGAQASTPREIQMLSLPITFFQMGMLGFATAAASQPDSWIARAAEIFPFSSPFAMAARAVARPELWPHLVALGWQALWVAATVALGAALFRRGVLKSGSPRRARRNAAAA